METLDVTDFTCTLYKNCIDGNGVLSNLYTWLNDIKNGTDRTAVEEIRGLTASGDKDQAGAKKRYLRAIVPTGYMPAGRKKEDPHQPNGVFMLDYDCHDKEWSESARDFLKDMPGVLAAYLTVNYGLRVLVYVGSYKPDDYFFLMNVVSGTLDEKLHYKHDEQAITLEHLTSASYDPNALIVAPDQLKPFPIEEELDKAQRKVYEEQYGLQMQTTSGDEGLPEKEMTIQDELDEVFDLCNRQEKGAFSKAQIDDMFTRFSMRNPLVPGSRNNNLLKLGRYAFYKRFTPEELDYLITITHVQIHCLEYTEKRIRKCVCWGYTHGDKQEFCKTNRSLEPEADSGLTYGRKSQKSQKFGPIGEFGREPIKLSESQGDFGVVVERCCPTFPETVYENLPPFLRNLVIEGKQKRDMDMSLLGLLGVWSGLMPKVTVEVRDDDYSANLYVLAIAPAGSGKSVLTKSRSLYKYVKTKITQLNRSREREYKMNKEKWELEQTIARKQCRPANVDLEPTPFFPMELEHSAQTSRSSIIHSLAHNPDGIAVVTAELDTFNESLKSDCGNHSAELRMIASNEPISCDYLKEDESIYQEKPKMTIVASGTPLQLVNFIGNTHDGMASRCLIMLGNNFPDWISWGDHDKRKSFTKKEMYEEAAKKAVLIYEHLQKYPTHVTIPEKLRRLCDWHFNLYTERLKEEEYDNLRSFVNRCPIHVSRICAILASIRKVEMGYEGVEIQATEEDMQVALGIVVTLLRHACIATTMLIEDGKQINKLKNVFKQEDVYRELPTEFTTMQLVDFFINKAQYSRSAATRILKRWESEMYIKKVKHGIYMKTGKLMNVQ